MNRSTQFHRIASLILLSALTGLAQAQSADTAKPAARPSSYTSVIEEDFATVMPRMKAQKAGIEQRQANLLKERYDLANRPAAGVTMSRGKPVQEGVRVKLKGDTSWDSLAALSPEEIRNRNLWPEGFFPLPHPNHGEGGMLFPQFQIDEVKIFKTCILPLLRLRSGIGVEHGDAGHVALLQAHAFAILQVDGGIEIERAHSSTRGLE